MAPAAASLASSDQAALARLGEQVRRRLASDPAVHALPAGSVELFAVGQFLTASECQRLIAIIEAEARPSALFTTPYDAGHRTSYSGDVDPHDPFVQMIERRIDDLLGIAPSWGETVQGQRYHPGQEFKAHHDYFHTTEAYWLDERDRGGQRSWTAMAFLNDVEAGGETAFPTLGLKVTPQAGALLVWNNMSQDGRVNPDTLHAGTPVVRGIKYIITKWYRARRWRDLVPAS